MTKLEWSLEELRLRKRGVILFGSGTLGSHCDKFMTRNPEYLYHDFIL